MRIEINGETSLAVMSMPLPPLAGEGRDGGMPRARCRSAASPHPALPRKRGRGEAGRALARWVAAFLCLGASVDRITVAAADDWPNKPVKLIVPFPAGGGTDVVSRIVANALGEALGQPVVVDNRGGAGGTLGSDLVAKAAPDGYTIGMATSSTHPAAVVLQKGVPYDPVKSFAAITMVGTTPYILVASEAVPARTLPEFLAHARANPGQLNYASVGVTTLGYLLTEQLKILTGTDIVHIPYKGSGQVYPDLIENRVSVLLDNPTGAAGHVKSGRLRAYAVTQPSSVLPEVPTFAQLGVTGFDTIFWYGLVAPAGTPPAIVARIRTEIARFAQSAQGRADLLAKDVQPVADTPEQFAATITADIARWRQLADRLGVQPE
jgi:tripartite-type tricarboxylate transporter receptor subunit TctC